LLAANLRYALRIAGNLGQAVLEEKSEWIPPMCSGSRNCSKIQLDLDPPTKQGDKPAGPLLKDEACSPLPWRIAWELLDARSTLSTGRIFSLDNQLQSARISDEEMEISKLYTV